MSGPFSGPMIAAAAPQCQLDCGGAGMFALCPYCKNGKKQAQKKAQKKHKSPGSGFVCGLGTPRGPYPKSSGVGALVR